MTLSIFIIIAIVFLVDLIIARFYKHPPFHYIKKSWMNYNAQTLPPFGIFIREDQAHNERLKKHELYHWEQYRRMGALFFQLKYLYYMTFYGYDHHPMEVMARKRTGEREDCIETYTDCVRKGKARTVHNPHFRKHL